MALSKEKLYIHSKAKKKKKNSKIEFTVGDSPVKKKKKKKRADGIRYLFL